MIGRMTWCDDFDLAVVCFWSKVGAAFVFVNH